MAAVGLAYGSEGVQKSVSQPPYHEPYNLARHHSSMRDIECNVCPLLTTAFFDGLAQHLPEQCRRYIFSDARNKEYDDPEDGAAYNEPHCQWLLGCWDAVLLPKCTRWITRASVKLHMVDGLPQPYQTACLIHALSCMSGVTQLTLLWDPERWQYT